MAAYATVSDLESYIGDQPPAGAERLLTRASDLIDWALIGVTYAVDANNMPTDTVKVIPALRDATCAQVEWWLSTGDELGEMARVGQYSIEGIQVTGQGAGPAQSRIAPRAFETLQINGLTRKVTIT